LIGAALVLSVARFAELMDKYLPAWRLRRHELNAAPLVLDENSAY
jgi:hypothetical protein